MTPIVTHTFTFPGGLFIIQEYVHGPQPCALEFIDPKQPARRSQYFPSAVDAFVALFSQQSQFPEWDGIEKERAATMAMESSRWESSHRWISSDQQDHDRPSVPVTRIPPLEAPQTLGCDDVQKVTSEFMKRLAVGDVWKTRAANKALHLTRMGGEVVLSGGFALAHAGR